MPSYDIYGSFEVPQAYGGHQGPMRYYGTSRYIGGAVAPYVTLHNIKHVQYDGNVTGGDQTSAGLRLGFRQGGAQVGDSIVWGYGARGKRTYQKLPAGNYTIGARGTMAGWNVVSAFRFYATLVTSNL